MCKWKHIFILFCGVWLLFGFVINVSYAVDNETQQELRENLRILGEKGLVSTTCYQNINLSNYFNSSYTKYAIIIGHGTSSRLGTTDKLYIYMGNGTQIYNQSNDSSSSLYYNWAYSGGDYVRYNLNGGAEQQGLFKLNDLVNPFYCYTTIPINTRVLTLGAGEEYGGNYLNNNIDFELASGDLLSSYEDYSNVTAIKNTYQNGYWYIGSFINLDSVTEVECKLIDLETNVNIGNKYKSLLINDGVYYESNLLQFGKVYRFYYDAYLDGTIIQNNFYDILFVSYSSGDSFNLQDLANVLLKNQLTASDISSILGEYPSGDGEPTGFLGGLLKGIKGLFIPSNDFLGSYFSDLNDWFSQRLGILYFPFDFIFDFLNRILTIDFSEPHMEIGPYQLPNYSGDVVPKIDIDFNDFLEEELVNNIHETYLLIVDGILIFWLVRLFQKKYDEVIGGKGS